MRPFSAASKMTWPLARPESQISPVDIRIPPDSGTQVEFEVWNPFCTARLSVLSAQRYTILFTAFVSRFFGDNLTPDNGTFLGLLRDMQSLLQYFERRLTVTIEMRVRLGASAVIYGPDEINGSRVAYAPTPAQGEAVSSQRISSQTPPPSRTLCIRPNANFFFPRERSITREALKQS